MTDGADKIELDGLMAPRWLAEMRAGSAHGEAVDKPRGFYVNYRHFAAVHVARGTKKLIVAFDNLSSVNDPSLGREAWGDKFYGENNWSSLGIISFKANWYRDETLFDYLEGLKRQGFFAQYEHVVFTGTSMGGYGACAFCSLAPGSTVIAFSPQSTLGKALVPWETRFHQGRKQDWSGRYGDAAAHCAAASRVYLCYDPYMPGDKGHADRFTGPNIVHLRANFVGHKTALFLRRAGILKKVTATCVQNNMTEARFSALFKARRALPWYYFGLMDIALERGHTTLTDRIIHGAAAEKVGPNLPRFLENRRAKFLEGQGEKTA